MKHKIEHVTHKLIREYRRSRTLFVMRATIVLLAVVLLVVKRSIWTPDTLFIVLLVPAVAFGQARAFLIRFVPLIALLLAYDSFRGVADDLNKNVNYWPMIHLDRFLFGGHLPTAVLQHWWWHGTVQWYDFYFYFLYTIHFLMPLLLAVLLWRVRDRLYWQFMWALIGLSFAAFITFLIFPAAPPWMANDQGFIEPIRRISSDIWYAMGVTNFSEVYDKLSPNPVAAVPSLHSAYPLLFALFITKLYGLRRTWWVYVYPFSMWVGVVYLGEHYVTDVLLGVLYAITAYIISDRYFAWYYSPRQRWQRFMRRVQSRLVPAFLRRS